MDMEVLGVGHYSRFVVLDESVDGLTVSSGGRPLHTLPDPKYTGRSFTK